MKNLISDPIEFEELESHLFSLLEKRTPRSNYKCSKCGSIDHRLLQKKGGNIFICTSCVVEMENIQIHQLQKLKNYKPVIPKKVKTFLGSLYFPGLAEKYFAELPS